MLLVCDDKPSSISSFRRGSLPCTHLSYSYLVY